MTRLVKRFIAVLTATVMCLSLGLTVSATETTPVGEPFSVDSTTSSISGYEQKTVTSTSPSFLVYCTSDGIGGMGITINNTCSTNYRIGVSVYEGDTGVLLIDNQTAYTDREVQFHDLFHWGGGPYLIKFHDIPEGVSVLSQVWIYG